MKRRKGMEETTMSSQASPLPMQGAGSATDPSTAHRAGAKQGTVSRQAEGGLATGQAARVRRVEQRVQTFQRLTSQTAYLDGSVAERLASGMELHIYEQSDRVGPLPDQGQQPGLQPRVATPMLVLGSLLGTGFALIASTLGLPALCVCLIYLIPVCLGIGLCVVLSRQRPGAQDSQSAPDQPQ